MKRILHIVLIFLPLFSSAQNLTPAWVAAIGGTGEDVVQTTVVDASGFVYIGGSFTGTVNFNPNGAITSLISNGETDAFFGKYTSAGVLVWIKQVGGTGSDEIYALDVNGSHVFVAGYFNNTVDFDPSGSVFNLSSNGLNDIFYGKYTTAGIFTWANAHGSIGYDQAIDIKVDASGNVYVTGFFEGVVDFDPSISTDFKTVTGGSGFDIFLCKYSSAGAKVWIDTFGSVGDDIGISIDLDVSNIYIAGYYSDGDLDFDPSAGLASVSNLGGSDAFFGKYLQSNGSFSSGATIRSNLQDEATSIVVSGTNVYVGGKFSSTASFYSMSGNVTKSSAGDYDIFVAKYDFGTATPTLTWVNQTGGSLDDGLNFMTSDASGNVYCSGYFQDVADFDPSPSSTLNLIAGGLSDIYIASYSGTGLLRFAKSIGDFDYDKGTTIALDPTNVNSLYVGGYFQSTASFDFSSSSQDKTAAGLKDGYVTKYTLSTLDAEPTAQPTNLTFNTVTDTGFKYAFTASSGNNITGYIHILKSGSASTFIPLDGTSYSLGQVQPDGSIVEYTDNFPSGDLSGLLAGTSYFIKIFAFNGSGTSINYLVTNPLSGNVTTTGGSLSVEPSNSPTNLVFSSITSTGYSFSFAAAVAGTTAPDGYIGIRRGGAAPTSVPVDGVTYVVGDVFGDGFINFIGTGTSYTQSSLTPSTAQHLAIYSYKGSGTTINYRQVSPLTGSVTTLAASVAPTVASFLPVSGTIGTSVTLTGTGFSTTAANNIVKFNGTTATITGIPTATSITVTVPTGATTGKISVEVAGQTGTSLTDFTVNTVTVATEPTNQPTTLTFSSITSSSYAFSFTAAVAGTTAPDGYIGIRREGAAPSSVPVDGVTYVVEGVFGDGFINFIGTGTSYTQSSALASKTYHLAIYSYKGSGTSINYKQVSPLTGSVTTLSDVDTTPPTITGNTTVKTSKAGDPIKVSITAADAESGIASAVIYYGESTSFDWTELDEPMTKVGNNWEYTIPGNVVKELGIEYKVIVSNGVGDEADTGVLGVTVTTDVNGPSVPFSGAGTAQSNYKIISIPLALESKTVNKIFGDDLGDYGDKSKWRMFRYSGGRTSELNGSSSINPGEAYWLISSTNATIDTGPGTTVGRISDPFKIQVTQGFNQIGNPYIINLLWSDVQTYSFDTNDNGTLGLGKLRVFNGTGFDDGLVLKRFEGGFVMAAKAGTLVFPAEKKSAAGRIEVKPVATVSNPIDGPDWEVNFELTNGIQAMNFGGIGMNKKASDEYDAFDDFTLPRFLDYIELNHDAKELYNLSYTKDIVPTAENHTWEFSVESNSNELVTMKWDNSFFGKNSKQLVLWDVNLQKGLDMRTENQYLFSKSRSGSLKVFYGDEKYVKEKTAVSQLVFHDVFPNPAKDNVTISFSLPKEDRVTIEVIDLLGKKIATVADGNFKEGYHEVTWNTLDNSGNAITNGIYITQIQGLKRDHQKRLSIIK